MATIWTEDDIETLKNAISSGVLTVHYAGPPARTITYQDSAEMWSSLAKIRAELNVDATPRTTYAYTKKGF